MNLRINIVLLLVVLSFRFTYTSSPFRIVNGSPADIDEMPYIVALTYHDDDYHAFCGGALVTMQIVVTAAHCLVKRAPRHITVLAGRANIRRPQQGRKVESTFHSCSYNPKTKHMDVGAVKLEAPFDKSPTVKVIPLCNIDLKPGTPMHVSGWGATCPDKDYQTILRKSVSNIIREEECKWYYQYEHIYKSMICAENEGSGFCFGDSGGPGVIDGQLCGVVSFTAHGCATSLYPLVYTNVKYIGVLRFIQKAMKC
ncbi:trypsin-like [Eurosta solidaginis]|uniref:trypsin-like n=1 Tax=Eurosta solidaginis TaxID=178769 RepID=UPI003530D0E3